MLLHSVEGAKVRAGEVIASVHAGDADRLPAALAELETALGVDAPGASANVIADAAPDAHAEPDAAARGPAGTVVRRIRGW